MPEAVGARDPCDGRSTLSRATSSTGSAPGSRASIAILAERLGVSGRRCRRSQRLRGAVPLVSVKFGELRPVRQRHSLQHGTGAGPSAPFRLFLHDLTERRLETSSSRRAALVYAGNEEIAQQVAPLARRVETLWSPATILEHRRFQPSEISVFSFGMAHKMRADIFGRLHALLEATDRTYALYVSNSNHESVTLGDAQLVYDEMHSGLPGGSLLPREPLRPRGVELHPRRHLLRRVLPERCSREQLDHRRRDGTAGGRGDQPRSSSHPATCAIWRP